MAWKKGQSGNPGGRPKAALHVRELARAKTEEAMNTLIKCLKSDDDRVRVQAATAILDRAWGKPAGSGGEHDDEFAGMSEAEIVAEMKAEIEKAEKPS